MTQTILLGCVSLSASRIDALEQNHYTVFLHEAFGNKVHCETFEEHQRFQAFDFFNKAQESFHKGERFEIHERNDTCHTG